MVINIFINLYSEKFSYNNVGKVFQFLLNSECVRNIETNVDKFGTN